jgi:beta-N-acetylhexosaminidase
MLDIAGTCLTDAERARLANPNVGGVILFARNYANPEQLRALTAELHALREPPLLIAIDQEGGRVQRCRAGFTRLPAMRQLGELWDRAPKTALCLARQCGHVLAAELRVCGVDFSFTPVLDLDHGRSSVIGDRAFHGAPEAVIALAEALIAGLKQAGMGCCGKHFPGHGWPLADSHTAQPVDERPRAALDADLAPFRALPLDAVMPAHVVYPQVDATHTACFSPAWHAILRQKLGFSGVVFSDDLSMEGASIAGDALARAEAAYRAGCDMLLICNAPEVAADALARWRQPIDPIRSARIARLTPLPFPCADFAALQAEAEYREAQAAVAAFTGIC